MECNKIIINGEEFYFMTEYGRWGSTVFYKDTEPVKTKITLFGMQLYEKYLGESPIVLFEISENIFNTAYSKEELTLIIQAEYKWWQKSLIDTQQFKLKMEERKKELENCEIINEIKL